MDGVKCPEIINAGSTYQNQIQTFLMEPRGQSPWFLKNAHKGRTSRTRGPIHPRVEPVVLLVRDSLKTENK